MLRRRRTITNVKGKGPMPTWALSAPSAAAQQEVVAGSAGGSMLANRNTAALGLSSRGVRVQAGGCAERDQSDQQGLPSDTAANGVVGGQPPEVRRSQRLAAKRQAVQ